MIHDVDDADDIDVKGDDDDDDCDNKWWWRDVVAVRGKAQAFAVCIYYIYTYGHVWSHMMIYDELWWYCIC